MKFKSLWDIFSEENADNPPNTCIRPIILIIIFGFALRLFVCQYTYIINSDGTIYIHQARAIYYGLWPAVNSCSSVNYLSIYPILIAAIYPVLGNWVASAETVSIFFGTIVLIPLYLLAKRFFEAKISILITLIFALTPIFVTVSVYVARDPVYWFFLVLGLYLFTGQTGQKNFRGLFLSSICFILATWARIEGILYIVVSCLYLLLIKEEKKFKRLAIFLLPPAFLLFFFIVGQMIFNPCDINLYRLEDIPSRLHTLTSQYQGVRVHLQELISHPPEGIPSGFFDNTYTLFWFVALGTIMQNAIEAFFYPFFLIFIIGLMGRDTWVKIREEKNVRYFAIIAASAVVLLYLYVFAYWEMQNRWFALLIFPSFIFTGFGLEKIIPFLKSKFRLKEHLVLSLVVLAIMVSALPKNLSPKEVDKLIFKEIGESMARIEGNSQEIKVLTLGNSARWIAFYANLHFKGAPCPDKYNNYGEIVGKSYEQFVRNLRTRGIQYVVLEETKWPPCSFDFVDLLNGKDFIILGEWSHPDTGRVILLKLL
ncbi:MAG: glycosyltransferase family 39 protein [Syntrophales bacterium]